MPSRRRVVVAALWVVAACSGGSRPSSAPQESPPGAVPTSPSVPSSPEVPTSPPVTPPAAVVVGSGSGSSAKSGSTAGNTSAIVISADRGLYFLDAAMAGETSFEGSVYVSMNGAAPPAETTVELNGVPLVRQELPGSPESPFHIDPAGVQPQPDADGMATITVKTGSLVRSMSLPCPPDLAVTTSTPPGGSLGGAPALQLSWTGDPNANEENPFPTDFGTTVKLMAYDSGSHGLAPGSIESRYVPSKESSVRFASVSPSPTGYCAEVRWQGKFFIDGKSRGFCGRAKRIEYAP